MLDAKACFDRLEKINPVMCVVSMRAFHFADLQQRLVLPRRKAITRLNFNFRFREMIMQDFGMKYLMNFCSGL